MTYREAYDAIAARFRAGNGGPYPLHDDPNWRQDQPPGGYVSLQVVWGRELPSAGAGAGAAFDAFGSAVLTLYVPRGAGIGPALRFVDEVGEIYRGQADGDVIYHGIRPAADGVDEDALFFSVSAFVHFELLNIHRR